MEMMVSYFIPHNFLIRHDGDRSCYLYCTVGQVHDDGLGGADPALDLRDGQVGVGVAP